MMRPNRARESVDGSLCGLSQKRLELGEGVLDRIEVEAVGQVENADSDGHGQRRTQLGEYFKARIRNAAFELYAGKSEANTSVREVAQAAGM